MHLNGISNVFDRASLKAQTRSILVANRIAEIMLQSLRIYFAQTSQCTVTDLDYLFADYFHDNRRASVRLPHFWTKDDVEVTRLKKPHFITYFEHFELCSRVEVSFVSFTNMLILIINQLVWAACKQSTSVNKANF